MEFHPNVLTVSLKSIEKVLDESQHSCEINLSGRNLNKFPEIASHFDLNDVISADLSKNCLTELPDFLCSYVSIEEINCYSNNIRFFPLALTNLQNLVLLNLSKNQLSVIPPFLFQLNSLEILRISNNKLTSLPESIGNLLLLKELDVNNNNLTHLPENIRKLNCLKCLYAKRNKINKLPIGLEELNLTHIDLSINRITHIPLEWCKLSLLDELNIEHNPLIVPPTEIVVKGKLHILSYLKIEYRKVNLQQSTRSLQDNSQIFLDKSLTINQNGDMHSNMDNNTFEASLIEINGYADERDTPEGGNSTENSLYSNSPSREILSTHKLCGSRQTSVDELDLKHIGFIVNGNDDTDDEILPCNGYTNGHSEESSIPSTDSPASQEKNEFRSRHHNLSQRRKQEAQRVKQMLEQQQNNDFQPAKFTFINESAKETESISGTTISPLSAGCLKALEVLSHEIDNGNPVFTIRRNIHLAALERESIEKLRELIFANLNINFSSDDLLPKLRDGVILCQLANQICPENNLHIYTPSPDKPILSESKKKKVPTATLR